MVFVLHTITLSSQFLRPAAIFGGSLTSKRTLSLGPRRFRGSRSRDQHPLLCQRRHPGHFRFNSLKIRNALRSAPPGGRESTVRAFANAALSNSNRKGATIYRSRAASDRIAGQRANLRAKQYDQMEGAKLCHIEQRSCTRSYRSSRWYPLVTVVPVSHGRTSPTREDITSWRQRTPAPERQRGTGRRIKENVRSPEQLLTNSWPG